MRIPNQGFSHTRSLFRTRDQAVSSFLDLGAKLKSGAADPARNGGAELPPEAAASLYRTIEGEIIPRLMLAHRDGETADAADADADPGPAPTAEDHERFLQTVLTDSAAATRSFVGALFERGVRRETIFLDLLATAARRLGELWEEDRCSFTDVTIGLCRLHQVLREESELDGHGIGVAPHGAPRVLLATACADQHMFGLVMVAEFFRRAGWSVSSEPGTTRSQLAAILSRDPFDVLGLSAACSAVLEDVRSEISMFRKASRNRALKVLVGGRLFLDAPELVEEVGADGTATDGKAAPVAARELLEPSTSGD